MSQKDFEISKILQNLGIKSESRHGGKIFPYFENFTLFGNKVWILPIPISSLKDEISTKEDVLTVLIPLFLFLIMILLIIH